MTRTLHLALAGLALLSALSVGLATGIGLDPEAFFQALRPATTLLTRGSVSPRRSASGGAAAASGRAPAWLEHAVCQRSDLPEPACALLALTIHEESKAAQLDPMLVLAVIEVESSWDTRAVSERGAHGLMQLRRVAFEAEARRARLEGVDRFQPVANVRAGIRYLARLHRSFRDPDLALVAFNAGPARVWAHLREEGRIPDRLRSYPRRVHRTERALRQELAPEAEPLLASAP
ncbi:MAG TPA: transglycosylase SLT domain-containing protein [Anaeromyxobacteraceae bacterium]|nr:transglycosylase SLT domain-containing protein [Anaeromyxobacteraceae bacterium]